MIRIDCEQGSAEWFSVRRGIPTASAFDKIITPKTMKLSGQAPAYAHRLLAEQILGISLDDASSGFMQRGSVMERHAIGYYEMKRDAEVERVGFVFRDDRRAGCSPDGFVGTDGLIEIKVPSAHVHVGYLLDDEGIGYRAQVQGQLSICEREWIDTISYHPDMPPALVRIHRDEEFIKQLNQALETFLEFMLESKIKLQKLGLFEGERIPDLKIA